MRILLILSTVFMLSSCDLLIAILEESPSPSGDPVSQLQLSDRSSRALFFHSYNLEGSVKNNSSHTIYHIVITATVTDKAGNKSTHTIKITSIDAGATTTYDESIYLNKEDFTPTLAITSAKWTCD